MTPHFVDGHKASSWWRQLAFTLVAPLLLPMLIMTAVGGAPMRLLYPVYALAVGGWLYWRLATHYPGFVLGVFAFAPLLRRLSDLDAGFVTLNWILVAPYAACTVSLLSLLTLIGRRRQPGALPLLVLTGCCLYAMFIALFQMRFLPVLYESLRWLMPLAIAAFVILQAGRAETMRRETVRALILIVVVVSVYGLYQYAALPAWDREWMLNVDNPTFGKAEPLQVRVFSTMNSPFSLAVFVACAMIILANERLTISLPVAALAVPLLGVTLLRTAWIGFVIGIFVLFLLADSRRKLAIALGLLAVPLATVVLLESRIVPAEVNATIMERIESILNPRSDFSASERLMVYDSFMSRLADSPWGEGYGANDSVLTKTSGRRALVSIDSALLEIYLVHGVIVGSLYYAALLALLWQGWQNLRRGDDQYRGFLAAAIASIAILPLGANHIGEAGILLWLSLGFLMAAPRVRVPLDRPD